MRTPELKPFSVTWSTDRAHVDAIGYNGGARRIYAATEGDAKALAPVLIAREWQIPEQAIVVDRVRAL